MSTYRLIVHRNQKLLGHFESSTPWASEAIDELVARLPASEGFELQLLVATDERRLIEASASGIRVLGREPVFTERSLAG
jgi:hypothetical protein